VKKEKESGYNCCPPCDVIIGYIQHLDVLWNAKNESEIRKTVLRQHSYRSAVRAFSASSK